MSDDALTQNLARIRSGIARAAARCGRDASDVTLVAASKTVPIASIRRARELGVTDFGENYVKELRDKVPQLSGSRWHFIGTLQSNTAQHVAELADVVETLASDRAAERLARRAVAAGRSIEALIEVDFTGGRTGISPDRTAAFADRVATLDGLRLVGLMTLPPMPAVGEDSRTFFVELRELRDRLAHAHPDLLELSMGMSLDYEVAVEEGATIVRIGTALFGDRPPV